MRTSTIAAAVCLAAACSDPAPRSTRPTREKPLVCTTIYPVHYLAQRVAGDLVELDCVIPAGADPLHWRPSDAAVQRMQEADLLLLNGADAEKWVFSLSLPESRTLRTANAFKKSFLVQEGVTHSHGSGDAHTHHGVDPHTWLDPTQAIQQAEEIRDRLAGLLPRHAEALTANCRAVAQELEALRTRLAALPVRPDGEVLVAAQAAYDYLGRRFGWSLRSLDLDAQLTPAAEDVEGVRIELDGAPAKLALWPSEPDAAWPQALQELGIRSVVFDPCMAVPAPGQPDYMQAMRANVERLEAAWR